MRDKSIIFSAESVRAILEGRKTQHRMVVKYQFPGAETVEFGMYHPIGVDKHGIAYPKELQFGAWSDNADIKCPYQIGQKLWVRETWFHGDGWYEDTPSMSWKNVHVDGKCTWVDYKATLKDADFCDKWCSPVTMPRWASRLSLEVTDIRCERLQSITESDAVAEGMYGKYLGVGYRYGSKHESVISQYSRLWYQTHGKNNPWDSNPWVWVIDFKEATV